MSRASYIVSLVPRVMLVLLIVVILIDMMVAVIFRYVVQKPLPWTEEVGNFCLIWLTFVGGAIGITRKAHFSIHLLLDYLSPMGQRILSTIVALVIAGLGLVLVPVAWKLMLASSTSQLPGLGISVGFQYAAALVGTVLFAWYAGTLALNTLRGKGVSPEDQKA